MKKIFLISSVILFVFMTAFMISGRSDSVNTTSTPLPTFQVTVYQTSSTTPQGYAEVIIENSSGATVKTGTTYSTTGIVSWVWDQPNGDYTIKTWYPARPNDQQTAQKTVTYSGASIYTTITLGPVY